MNISDIVAVQSEARRKVTTSTPIHISFFLFCFLLSLFSCLCVMQFWSWRIVPSAMHLSAYAFSCLSFSPSHAHEYKISSVRSSCGGEQQFEENSSRPHWHSPSQNGSLRSTSRQLQLARHPVCVFHFGFTYQFNLWTANLMNGNASLRIMFL